MIIAHPEMENEVKIGFENVSTIVIENRDFFARYLRDISTQISGGSGLAVLSENDKILDFSKNADLIDSFLNFTLNRKTLLNKINAVLEKTAVSSDHYTRTLELLSDLERYVDELTEEYSCNLVCNKITPGAIIKAVGVTIEDDYDNPLEQIFDYMELVREFDKDRLFIFVNMRAYFNDEQLTAFFESILSHEYHILLVDAFSAELLPNEKRLTIDDDLCEF